jgi:hypothetical protein
MSNNGSPTRLLLREYELDALILQALVLQLTEPTVAQELEVSTWEMGTIVFDFNAKQWPVVSLFVICKYLIYNL